MNYLKLAFTSRALEGGETPDSFFGRLRGTYSILFQSGGSGRYSYIAFDPFAVSWSRNGLTQLSCLRDFFDWKKSMVTRLADGRPLGVLRRLYRHFEFKGKSPVPFPGGMAGFLGYDFGASLMGIRQRVFDDVKLPDFVFCFYDKVIVFDHENNEVIFLALDETDLKAAKKADGILKQLGRASWLVRAGDLGPLKSNISLDQYYDKISRIKSYLQCGETYQVNFSQRFSAPCTLDPWKVYLKLFKINPSPYSCFFDFPDFQIASSSPELLLNKRSDNLCTRPIKGTVARVGTASADRRNVRKLVLSKKDRAELDMIVDLERNDLGKVCVPGSIHVTEHRAVEKYAHVIHTVSTVNGKLSDKKDFFDAVEALFPGGSITGCPKRRTMEIIDKLEDYKREVYTGSGGFLGFSGDGDLNILIRTILFKDGKLFFHSGGGIVIDSNPDKEYRESLDKAESLCKALADSSGGS